MKAVFDQDLRHVCVLQGLVAAKHAKVANGPIKDMPGGVESGLVTKFLEKYYYGDESKVPTIDYIGASPAVKPAGVVEKHSIQIDETESSATLKLGQSLSPVPARMELLAGAGSTPPSL
jgi:enoyl reductase-like protein